MLVICHFNINLTEAVFMHEAAYVYSIWSTLYRGKKITCPAAGALDKLNFRQDKHIFSPNVRRTSKNLNASKFFLDKDKLFGNRTSKNFDGLARGTSENF